jgi:cbb3-type cytochrome oxidase subunit 3
MTYPPDDYRDSGNGMRLEHDRSIINGSMLALVAFVIVAIGIVWYALTDGRAHIAAVKQPGVERSVPDSTTGYGGTQPKAPATKSIPCALDTHP